MIGFKTPDRLPVSGGGMKVELDKRSLFALASDTRVEMLKALEVNRRTVSQLAEVLQIDKAAVHRHLKKLEEGGFVTRTEDHGFVYYALTWKSRDILNPNDKTKIVILFSAALICVLAMAILVYVAASSGGTSTVGSLAEGKGEQASGQNTDQDSGSPASTTPASGWAVEIPIGILGSAATALALSAYLVWRTPRQRVGAEKDVPLVVERSTLEDD